jgi:hypothetical protein
MGMFVNGAVADSTGLRVPTAQTPKIFMGSCQDELDASEPVLVMPLVQRRQSAEVI